MTDYLTASRLRSSMVVSVLEFSVCSDVGSVLLTDCNEDAIDFPIFNPLMSTIIIKTTLKIICRRKT